MTKRKTKKRPVLPPFSSVSARMAQPLAVMARRATDARLRRELADLVPRLTMSLRGDLVEALPIRRVESILAQARALARNGAI